MFNIVQQTKNYLDACFNHYGERLSLPAPLTIANKHGSGFTVNPDGIVSNVKGKFVVSAGVLLSTTVEGDYHVYFSLHRNGESFGNYGYCFFGTNDVAHNENIVDLNPGDVLTFSIWSGRDSVCAVWGSGHSYITITEVL